MARPVILVAMSSDFVKDPMARNKEYMVIVMIHSMRRLMKNWDAVFESPAIQYTTISKMRTCTRTSGASTTVCAIAYAAGLWKELIADN